MSWSFSVARWSNRLGPLVLALAVVGGVLLAAPQVLPAPRGGSCKVQKPQRFLQRRHYVKNGMLDGRAHNKALAYRVRHYGHVPGMGLEKLNSVAAASQAISTTFFDKPLTVHKKIVPALACVEDRIRSRCTSSDSRYEPRHVGGLRTENTIRGGEISNHLFGIAVDIDPERNPCCHCVKKWQSNPKCKKPSKSPFDRADLPRCWVEAFERYGFHWLGRDQLEDTMHFEFLGDPDKLTR